MPQPLEYQSPPPQELAEPLPGARTALMLLLAINLFNYIDRYVLAAVEPRIRKEFFGGDSDAAMAKTGLLATAFVFSYMLAAPIFGWLADRMSRWVLVAIGVLVWSAATGAGGLAPIFNLLLLTRIFVGIGEAGYGPSAPAIISDFYPVCRRGQVLAWFYAAIPVGAALGYGIGGLIGSLFGWRPAFFAVFFPGIILGVMALRMKEPLKGKADAAERGARKAKLSDYLLLLKIPSYVLDCAGMAALTFAIGGISYWMPAYLDYRHAGSEGTRSLVFGGILALAGLTATLAGGWAGDWLRTRFSGSYFIVSGVGVLIGVPFVLLMLVTPFPACWVVIFIAIFFLFFNTGPANAILANVTHPSIRATGFALNILIIHALGDALAPPALGEIVGPFNKVYHWNAAFGLISAVMVLAGFLWWCGAVYLERDTERAAHQFKNEAN